MNKSDYSVISLEELPPPLRVINIYKDGVSKFKRRKTEKRKMSRQNNFAFLRI